jgi:hypothetical protein
MSTRRRPVYLWRLVQARGDTPKWPQYPRLGAIPGGAAKSLAGATPSPTWLSPRKPHARTRARDAPVFVDRQAERSTLAVISAIISTIGGDRNRPRAARRARHTPDLRARARPSASVAAVLGGREMRRRLFWVPHARSSGPRRGGLA